MSDQRSKAICVLGMHRSGTSAITRAINLMGAYVGRPDQLMPPKEGNNPEGFWEHTEIVKIQDNILHRLSSHWDTTIPLPEKWWEFTEIQPFKEELVQLIRGEFLQYSLWVFKDPRTSLLLPLWKEIFNELNIDVSYVVTLRNPLDVAASLKKRDSFSEEKSFGIWTLYTLSALKYSNDSNRILIHYDRFLEDWETTLRNVATVCNIPWPEDEAKFKNEITKFLKPDLRHSQSKLEDLQGNNQVPSSMISIYHYSNEAEKSPNILQLDEFKENINRLFQYYVVSAKMISSNCNSENKEEQRLQVYWGNEKGYSEENSSSVNLNSDGEFHTYEVSIPTKVTGQLRLDPVNFPGIVEIKSLELYEEENNKETHILLKNYSAENNFEGLSRRNNGLLINTRETVKFFAVNKDPQFILEGIPVIKTEQPLSLRIIMKAEEHSDSNTINILESEFTFLTTEINQYASDLENKVVEINQQKDELSRVNTLLMEKEKKLLEQRDELSRVNKELMVKEEESSNQKNELATLKLQLQITEEQLENSKNEISNIKTRMQFQEQQLNELFSSTSWKITAPMRWSGKKIREIKNAIKSIFQIIFRMKYNLKLIPIYHLKEGDKKGNWKSIGDDPQFILEGKFPVGWVEISWKSSSNSHIPLKLYCDDGTGMKEENSIILGSISSGEEKYQKSFVFLSLTAKSLRLDPGERESGFTLSDIVMRKVSRIHVSLRAVRSYFKTHGLSYRSVLRLFNQARVVYALEGIRGLWSKLKGNSSVQIARDSFQEYEQWVKIMELTEERRKEILDHISNLSYQPLISVIVPVYNVEERWLRKCIESVQNQLYPNWELCIADDASSKEHVKDVLQEYASKDSRIKIVFRETNGHISEASNSALELATGEFIALLDHDDELTPDALYENVVLLNRHPDADMIYSDEDKISEDGNRHSPFFKPDWSPDTLLSQMYIGHLSVYRTNLVRNIGGFRKGFEGSQDYDLVLRLTEKTNRIFHIPKILYHWRTIPQSTASSGNTKGYTHEAGLRAIKEALIRRKVNGWVEEDESIPHVYRVHYRPEGEPLISILIPTRDMSGILDTCLTSIFEKTSYKNFEVLIIDNGSEQQETFNVFAKWLKREPERVRVERMEIPFNYSMLNNLAVQSAKGELILLLNNDIEVLSPDWLEEMVGQAARSNIGAVGAMLLYPDQTIQHAGVVLGIGGVAGHSHKHYSISSPGYFSRLRLITNYSAVTAACLMIRKEVYERVNGLDENLAVAFNDIDFCLKVRGLGLNNLWLPHVRLFHHESKSRGYENTPERQARFLKEINIMKERWGDLLLNDPFYNPNLTLDREDFSIRVP
jgi:glycosyltransferase involved in cell wall biosynthesis